MADAGAIGGAKDEKALIAAHAAYGAEAEDTEEPIPERAVGVVERFGVAGGTGLSVRKHGSSLSAGGVLSLSLQRLIWGRIPSLFFFPPQIWNEDFLVSCLPPHQPHS